MSEKNTEAKYLLKDFDFSKDNAHIAYTINALGGSAAQVSDETAYVFKSDNLEMTEKQKEILADIKKATLDDPSLEDLLRDSIKEQINAILPDIYVSCWIEKITPTNVYFELDYTTYYAPYTINGQEVTVSLNDRVEVERKYVYVEVIEEGDIMKSQDPSIFAYTPDLEKPETWRCRLDSADLVKASVNDLSRFNVDSADSYEKVIEAYKKFFPEEDLPISLEKSYSSGAASDGDKKKSMPSGIDNDKKEKKSMSKKEEVVEKATDENVEVVEKATETVEDSKTEDLQKSLDEVTKLLKAANEKAEKAEKEAAEIKKAAEEAEIKKAKDDMTEVVKAYGFEEEGDLVEAIFKAGDASAVILKALEELHQKVEKTKEDFGETEHGQDGTVETPSDLEKTKTSVADILKARKAKNNAK